MKIMIIAIAVLGTVAHGIVCAQQQQPGQAGGQAAAMQRTRSDTGPWTYRDEELKYSNIPISGIGTGQIFFDGHVVPKRWEIGDLADAPFMAANSLFAINFLQGGVSTTRMLQADFASKSVQPTKSQRTNYNKQGEYFIGTVELPSGGWDDAETLVLQSDTFKMPSGCTQISVLIGGGSDLNSIYFALVNAANDKIIGKLAGDNGDAMVRKTITVDPASAGDSVYFTIVDQSTGGWGHIDIDDIQLKSASGAIVPSTFLNGDFETGDLTGWHLKQETKAGSYSANNDQHVTASFRYPISSFSFSDPAAPVDARLDMFSPMVPMDEKDSSIPAGIFTLSLTNKLTIPIDVSVLSTLANGLAGKRRNQAFSDADGSYVMMTSEGELPADKQGSLCLWTRAPGAVCMAGSPSADALIAKLTQQGHLDAQPSADGMSPVGGINASVTLAAGETKSVSFAWFWYFPHFSGSAIYAQSEVSRRYCFYYRDIAEVMHDVSRRWDNVVGNTELYSKALFDTTLPFYIMDAAATTVDVLRSPTFFAHKNGELCASEGVGLGFANCNHVWNYGEAMGALYPELARRWSTQVFIQNQTESGLLNSRFSVIPFPAKAREKESEFWNGPTIDGHCGDIVNAYREHLNAPDRDFLTSLWPNIKKAMEGAIAAWDPNHDGINEFTANTTMDEAFFGEYTFTTGYYHAALRATAEMATIMGDSQAAEFYNSLWKKGGAKLDIDTFNGEYYYQLGGTQHGISCATDQLIGQTRALLYGLGYLLPVDHVRTAAKAVFTYNFFGGQKNKEDRMLLTTQPNGGSPTNKFSGADMSGFSYAAAVNLMYQGYIDEALTIVHGMRVRLKDPLNEPEWGDYYGRQMSAYGLLIAASGIEMNGPGKMLGFQPRIQPDDFKSFFASVGGWGTFQQQRSVTPQGIRQSDTISVKYGSLSIRELRVYLPDGTDAQGVKAAIDVSGVSIPANVTTTGNRIELRLESDATVPAGKSINIILVK